MLNEYDAIADISRRYPGAAFRNEADVRQGQTFSARWVAVWVPRRFLRGPAYHIHEVNSLGLLGQRVETVPFEEVRHVGA